MLKVSIEELTKSGIISKDFKYGEDDLGLTQICQMAFEYNFRITGN